MKQNLTITKLLLATLLLVTQSAGFAKEATANQANYIIDEAVRSVKSQTNPTNDNKKSLNLNKLK